ncbi:MAG TPA: YdeI/OmpD-associated family protein [Polyangiaceae bacterium]
MSPAKKPSAEPSFQFVAKVVRVGSMYGVDVPAAVSRAVGIRGHVSVVGIVNGVPWRGTISPKGGGRHRMMLNAEVRRAAGASLDDRIEVRLRVDRDPPSLPTPEDLAFALHEEGAFEAFASIARGRRNHIVMWLEKAVHDETRVKRIARIVEIAHAEREKKLDRATSRSARSRS